MDLIKENEFEDFMSAILLWPQYINTWITSE